VVACPTIDRVDDRPRCGRPFDTELLRTQTPDPSAVGAMTILERVAAPDEIVGPALMLASNAGSFMTGQVLMVDGGFVIAR
jgi:NAD(P)-dependent dehydrogenase (short-subunit alcohol dehydrogenase family)